MKTYLPLVGCAVALWLAGCAAQQPIATGKMEPEVRALIEQRRIEPGFTPEMVFLALGKPQTPAEGLADSATDGVWIYQDFAPGEKAFLAPGFVRRIVRDEKTQRERVTTERAPPGMLAGLAPNALRVTYQKGRVVEIVRSGPASAGETPVHAAGEVRG
jgi:hypothetical protein